MKRTYWTSSWLDKRRNSDDPLLADPEIVTQVPEDDAQLVGSMTPEGVHAPVLDLDFPASLVPSTTPGHFHLYLDVAMPWEEYVTLLRALSAAGIIEDGYCEASIRRGLTMVRKPGTRKLTT